MPGALAIAGSTMWQYCVCRQHERMGLIFPRRCLHMLQAICRCLTHMHSGASTCRTLPVHSKDTAKEPAHWADKYILAACAGAVGGLSVLFGSLCSRSLAVEGLNVFADPFFYCYLIAMLVCVITQTSLLNQAMVLGDMMSIFPVFESFWISFGVLGGLVFYNDRLPSGAWEQAYGLIFMLAGTVCFLMHPDPSLRDRSLIKEATLADHLSNFGDSFAALPAHIHQLGDAVSYR